MKLWQVLEDETLTARIDKRDSGACRHDGLLQVCPLQQIDHEQVSLLRRSPGHALRPDSQVGVEIPILEGRLLDEATELSHI